MEERGAESIVTELAPQVQEAFVRGGGQPILDDERTQLILNARRAAPKVSDSERAEIQRRTELVREPVDPQAMLERERAERRVHEREQEVPA
jgi:hypothetical protein